MARPTRRRPTIRPALSASIAVVGVFARISMPPRCSRCGVVRVRRSSSIVVVRMHGLAAFRHLAANN